MQQSITSSTSKTKNIFNKWIAPTIVFIYLIIAIITFIIIPIQASTWIDIPFIGSFVENTLLLSNTPPSRPGTWEVYNLNLDFGYQVTSIDNKTITHPDHISNILSSYEFNSSAILNLRSPQGEFESFEIILPEFPLVDRIAYFYIPYVIGLFYLGSSLWVYFLRRQDTTGRSFAIFTISVAIGISSLFDIYTTNRLPYLWTIAIAIAGGAIINLALIFPQKSKIVIKYPFIRWFGYILSLILIIYALPTLFDFNVPFAYITAWRFEYLYAAFGIFFFLVLTAIRRYKSVSPVVRQQSRLILWGATISFLPLGIWFLLTLIRHDILFSPYLLIPTIAFPLFITYTIIKFGLPKTDKIINRAIIYSVLTILVAVGYALLVSGTTLIFGKTIFADNPILIGILVFLLALLFNPIRNTLQKTVDKEFQHSQVDSNEQIQEFNHEITETLELLAIVELLNKFIHYKLSPSQVHIYTHDHLSNYYVASPIAADDNKPTSDLQFSPSSPLVKTLESEDSPVFLTQSKTLPIDLQPEQARLALLGSQLYVPLPGRHKLTGWVALGPQFTGESYSDNDLEYIEALCDQAAIGIERAQVVSNLEQRVHEMDVLTRVSQGVNITVDIDDMLELIYAQTNQIVQSDDFCITLYDISTDLLYHVFYLENNERITDKENLPIPEGWGLEREVLRKRNSVVTKDYERECRGNGIIPLAEGVIAWIGTPLNAGAETIGLISLGSRSSSTHYSNEQVKLVQAIADQAAGAIVKARLLQEADRRTKQLTTLNEVARSLASTLELDPLLNRILNSAVEILNCEAGSLLLVDEDSGELVFEDAVGPVADELIGQRLPPGKGMVGKAVDTRKPIIANDARRSKDWFEKTDEQTGFYTRDILVVPMQVKEQVIGVIEVINRQDGLPFTFSDQELLIAFSSQAAIAYDNARLYTVTDQSLTARVQELSVMQRIDRELNASLDLNRSMKITLEWALRQSNANAGIAGLIIDNHVEIIASEGYSKELSTTEDSRMPIDFPTIKSSVDTGKFQHYLGSGNDPNEVDELFILMGAHSQVVIPIRRETEVIGIVLLESTSSDTYTNEMVAFLTRLSDHAAIAIANAQLYAEVQAANVAKSDFVSFVSHELKTPMTSIKGFSDLLAAGVVGPINDAQSNFLNTIRSNVDRMAILVSDLTDVSRIEAGRLRLEFEAVPISIIVDEVVRSNKGQIEEKEQELSLNIPQELPAMWGDRTRLIQILTNLVSNANKYTDNAGEITISAELSDNIWNANGSPNVLHISVEDDGYGISPDDQKMIYQKFFRADDEKVREAAGTGLGLNITKTLVEMQGGTIWFESELNKGTIFHFTVPIVESA
jgi:signal transduction histidine kinase